MVVGVGNGPVDKVYFGLIAVANWRVPRGFVSCFFSKRANIIIKYFSQSVFVLLKPLSYKEKHISARLISGAFKAECKTWKHHSGFLKGIHAS